MRTVHLINPMESAAGGSEHRTIGLFEWIGEVAEVRIWSEGNPDPDFLGRVPIQQIAPGSFPKDGVFVFVGTYFGIGAWARSAKPDRVVVIHNLDQPERLRGYQKSLKDLDYPEPEVVYASPDLAARTPETPGMVQSSPIDLYRFSPVPSKNRQFTVGRLSRDVSLKHHPEDIELYRLLGNLGFRVRIMGGTSLDCVHPNVELLPENAEDAAQFLQTLDAFVFRTHPDWYETFGRVVFEAMSCGLPVVVEPRQGFAAWLTDGHDAIFAESNDDFVQSIERLKIDGDLRSRIGENARLRIESMYRDDYRVQVQNFYAG